jgi:hypothetical protein
MTRLSKRGLSLLLPLAGLVACGGAPMNRVNGTVQGAALTASEASLLTGAQLGGNATEAAVLISDAIGPLGSNGVCASLNQGGVKGSGLTMLGLTLVQTDAAGNKVVPAPGDYAITVQDSPPASTAVKTAAAGLIRFDSSSGPLKVNFQATSGTVHVSSLSFATGSRAQGSFDLMFGADRLSGTFNAESCVTRP